jgi:hypothetical protein
MRSGDEARTFPKGAERRRERMLLIDMSTSTPSSGPYPIIQ